MRIEQGKVGKILRFLLLGFAFSCPLSIALSELFAYLALALWVFKVLYFRNFTFVRNPFLVPIFLFAGVAIYASVNGIRPDVSLDKIHRLSLLALIFLLAESFPAGRQNGARVMMFYLAGCTGLGLLDLIRVPWEVHTGVSLYDTGNMRDPQMYMTALCFLFAAWLFSPENWSRGWLLAVTVVNGMGLILHFKRGSWFSCFVALGLMSLFAGRWKWMLYLVLAASALILVPQARDRLDMLRSEWSLRQGGRYVLWTEVAPVLIGEYPRGMGYAATKAEDFHRFKYVQPNLNHLHNNVLQIRLETGRAGLAVWLAWMAFAFGLFFVNDRAAVRAAGQNLAAPRWLALGALGAFCGLMMNGVVEYNFGDSEILMLMALLMGLACLLRQQARLTGANPAALHGS
ncbi:MAG: O-antigen ligase family protein [Lentisphaerota bacterium]